MAAQKQPPEVFFKEKYQKRPWHRCFPVNFVDILTTDFLQNTSGRLLLAVVAFSNVWKFHLRNPQVKLKKHIGVELFFDFFYEVA